MKNWQNRLHEIEEIVFELIQTLNDGSGNDEIQRALSEIQREVGWSIMGLTDEVLGMLELTHIVTVSGPIDDRIKGNGIDLKSQNSAEIQPGSSVRIPTGVTVQFPDQGYYGLIISRSGLASRGIRIANGVGLIDYNYTGVLEVLLENTTNDVYTVEKNDRIAQLLVQNVSYGRGINFQPFLEEFESRWDILISEKHTTSDFTHSAYRLIEDSVAKLFFLLRPFLIAHEVRGIFYRLKIVLTELISYSITLNFVLYNSCKKYSKNFHIQKGLNSNLDRQEYVYRRNIKKDSMKKINFFINKFTSQRFRFRFRFCSSGSDFSQPKFEYNRKDKGFGSTGK